MRPIRAFSLAAVSRAPRGEVGCGDEQALADILQGKRAEEIPNGSRAYGVAPLISLGLNIQLIDPERVLVDHAIDAVVAGPTYDFACRTLCTVAHARQQTNHASLEEARIVLKKPVQEVFLQGIAHLTVSLAKHLIRRLRKALIAIEASGTAFASLR